MGKRRKFLSNGKCIVCSLKHPPINLKIIKLDVNSLSSSTKASKMLRKERIRHFPQPKEYKFKQMFYGKVKYDGKNYHGFQKQLINGKFNLPTIQTILENSFYKVFNFAENNKTEKEFTTLEYGEYEYFFSTDNEINFNLPRPRVIVVGLSRTDAGVHSVGQIYHVNIYSHKPLTSYYSGSLSLEYTKNILTQINENLDRLNHKITLLSLQPTSLNIIDLKQLIVSKEYHYYLYDGLEKYPELSVNFYDLYSNDQRKYAPHTIKSLDITKMKLVCKWISEQKKPLNFRRFTRSQKRKTDKSSTLRKIFKINIFKEDGGLIKLEIAGEGFLYLMVRCLVRMLIQVGNGTTTVDEALASFDLAESEDINPKDVFAPASPTGLTLQETVLKDINLLK